MTEVSTRRWVISKPGSVTNIAMEAATVPLPAAGEVQIAVKAVGVNFADVFITLGLYPTVQPSPSNPFCLGFEIAGVIEKTSADVSDAFQLGQRVFALLPSGGYATTVNVPGVYVLPIPDNWSFAQAASFPVQIITAYYTLVILGGLKPLDAGFEDKFSGFRLPKNVLIHSAAGGVGQRAVQMTLKAGVIPVCVVGSKTKAQYLTQNFNVPREKIIIRGVDERNTREFVAAATERALGSRDCGYDIVLDSMGGRYFKAGWASLSNQGSTYVVFGAASLMPRGSLSPLRFQGIGHLLRLGWSFATRPKVDVVRASAECRSLRFFNLGVLTGGERGSVAADILKRCVDLDLPDAAVAKEFDFNHAADALTYLQSGANVGKVCLVVA